MTDAAPSYRVGTSPMPVRSEPDPALSPVTELAPGDEVGVLDRRGAWAEVMTLSGIRGWVDGGQLVQAQPVAAPALPPPAMVATRPPPDNGERNAWIFIGVVAAIVILAAVLISGSGGGDTSTQVASQSVPPTTTDFPKPNLVNYHVPAGWSTSNDGLVIAEKQSDLTAAKPAGARISAAVLSNIDDPVKVIQGQLSSASSVEVIEQPNAAASVSGQPALRMTIRRGDQIVQYIVVHPSERDSVLFTVESPADRFEQLQDAINSAPGLNL